MRSGGTSEPTGLEHMSDEEVMKHGRHLHRIGLSRSVAANNVVIEALRRGLIPAEPEAPPSKVTVIDYGPVRQ